MKTRAHGTAFEVEELLRQTAGLHVLALQLVRGDRDAAEDLLQETRARALLRSIDARPWLRGVLRRLAARRARDAARRDRREQVAARSEVEASVAEVLAREEARARLVELVLALEEPYRSSIVLRYFEELPPRAIAKRCGVSVDTVKTRLKRALAELRTRCDRDGRGPESYLGALLVPELAAGAIPSAASLASIGVLLMVAWKKLALATAVLALAALGVLWVQRDAALSPPDPENAPRTEPPRTEPTEVAAAGDAALVERRKSSAETPADATVAAPAAEPGRTTTLVRGRCVYASSGDPIAGCRARIETMRETQKGAPREKVELGSALSSADGSFELAIEPEPRELHFLYIEREGLGTRFGRFGQISAAEVTRGIDFGDIALGAGRVVRGTTVDAAGRPIGEAHFLLEGENFSITAPGDIPRVSGVDLKSDREGRFESRHPLAFGTWKLSMLSNHLALLKPTSAELSAETVELEIVLRSIPRIRGRIICATGGDLPHITVEGTTATGTYEAVTEKDGTFALLGKLDDPGPVSLRIAPGHFDAYAHPSAVPWDTDALELPVQRAGALEILVVDAVSGEPIPSYQVQHNQVGGKTRDEVIQIARRDSGGRLVLSGMSPGEHLLIVDPTKPEHLPSEELRVQVPATAIPFRIALRRALVLDVRVEEADGTPVQLALVELIDPRGGPPVTDTSSAREPAPGRPLLPQEHWRIAAGSTDAQGRTRLGAREGTRDLTLRVRAKFGLMHLTQGIPWVRESGPLRVTLPPSVRLAGRVEPASVSRLKAAVVLGPADQLQLANNNLARRAYVQEAGAFDLGPVAVGTWNLYLLAGDAGAEAPAAVVELVAGKPADIEIDGRHLLPASLKGRLRLSERNASGVVVELHGISPMRTALTNAEGVFAFADLPPCTALVVAQVPDRWSAVHPVLAATNVSIGNGQSVEIEAELKWRTVTVRVVQEDGRTPLANAELWLRHWEEPNFSTIVQTDRAGRVKLDYLPLHDVALIPVEDKSWIATIPAGAETDAGDVVLRRR